MAKIIPKFLKKIHEKLAERYVVAIDTFFDQDN